MMRQAVGLWILLMSLGMSLHSQLGIGNGRIAGTIKDETGRPLEGARISITNMTYKNAFTRTSDRKGQWSLTGIASGRYEIKVSMEGYPDSETVLDVSFAQFLTQRLDVTLKKIAVTAKTEAPTRDQAFALLVKEGNALYGQKRYGEAAMKYASALAANPKSYGVNINLGNCLLELRELDRALEVYRAYLAGLEEDLGGWTGNAEAAQVLATIGRIHLERQDVEKGKEYFKLAIDAFPTDAVIPYNLGEILFNQGQSAEAIEYLKMAVQLRANWAPPHLKLGYAYLNRGEFEDARRSFAKFLELSPEDLQAPAVKALLPQVEDLAKKQPRKK